MKEDSLLGIYLETFPALLISGIISLIPGFFLSSYAGTLSQISGLLTLVPAIIGMRGNIFGSFCAHMSSLHHQSEGLVGQEGLRSLEIAGRRNATLAEVLLLSLLLPIMSSFIFRMLGKPIASLDLLIFICVTSGVCSGILLLLVSIFTIRMVRKSGLDPDNIAPPIVTTLGDVVTLPIISACAFSASHFPIPLWIVNMLGFFLMVYFLKNTQFYSTRIFNSTLVQRVPVLIICLILSSIAGMAIEEYVNIISPSYLFFIPLVNAQGGNTGSIFASRISSSLTVSKLEHAHEQRWTQTIFSKERIIESIAVTLAMICVFVSVGFFVNLVTTDPEASSSSRILLLFITLSLILGCFSELSAVTISCISVVCGLNPDDVAIACVCAFMDLLGTCSFSGLLYLFGFIIL